MSFLVLGKTAEYKQYLTDLLDYLLSFFRRTQPLFDLNGTLHQFEEDFKKAWADSSFVPVGQTDAEREKGMYSLHRVACSVSCRD